MDEQLNDLKMARLELSGYTEGTVTDREIQYLKAATGWEVGDSQSYNDLMGFWLETKGFSGQVNDMLFEYLGSEGFNLSDHLSDRLYDWWASTEVLP